MRQLHKLASWCNSFGSPVNKIASNPNLDKVLLHALATVGALKYLGKIDPR
jgi:hypothetical protein